MHWKANSEKYRLYCNEQFSEIMLVSNFVLGNLPPTYNQERIKDFVEGTLDLDVKNVVMHQNLQGKALVILWSEIDFAEATESLKEAAIEKQVVEVQETTEKPFTVIVQDVEPQFLSQEFLEMYFCAEFGDGEDIVISSQMIQNLKMAIVAFKTSNIVMKRILGKQDHVPLPSENYHIFIEPYYTQFHDYLNQESEDFEGNIKERSDVLLSKLSNQTGSEDFQMEEDIGDYDDSYFSQNTNTGKEGSEPEDEQDKQEVGPDDDDHGDSMEEKFYDVEESELEVPHNFYTERELQYSQEIEKSSFHRGNFRGRKLHHNKNIHHLNRGTKHSDHKTFKSEKERETAHPDFLTSLKGDRSKTLRGRGHSSRKTIPPRIQRQFENDFTTYLNKKVQEEIMVFDCNQSNSESGNIHRQQTYTRGRQPDTQAIHSNSQIVNQADKSRGQQQWIQESLLKPFSLREPVEKKKFSLLKHCINDSDECKVRYDSEHEEFFFEGIEEDVRQRHLKLLTEIKKIKEEVVEMTPAMTEILSSTWQNQCITSLTNLVKDSECKIIFEKPTLRILAIGEQHLKKSVEKIRAEIKGFHTIKINENITQTDFHNMKCLYETKFPVIISLSREGIVVEGMKEDVKFATENLDDKLHNLLEVTDKFEVAGTKVVYLNNDFMGKISVLLKGVRIDIQSKSDIKVILTVTGVKPCVQEAMKKLRDIVSKIQSKTWNLDLEFPKGEDLKLVVDALSKAPYFLNQFERNHHCLLKCKLSKSVPFPQPYLHKQKDSGSKKNKYAKSKTRAQSKQPAYEQEKPLVYTLSNSCQLVLQQSAKITQENSSALVCVLDGKVDLRKTSVGKDFNTACPTLWKQLQETLEGSTPGTHVLVTNGPFKGLPPTCQVVYHAILSKWAPGRSEASLADVIKMLIMNASTSRITSISIPPLGCGRLFGFPSQTVAQIMIQVLCSTAAQSSLKRVVLLADSQLLGDYKAEAQKALHSVASAPSTMVGNKPQDEKTESDDDSENSFSESEETESSDEENTDYSSTERKTSFVPHYESSNSVTLWTENAQSLDNLWANLKNIIATHSLLVKHFNQSEFKNWPKHFVKQILSKRNQESVWVEIGHNPKTNMASFMVKGEEHAVEKMMSTIDWAFKFLLEKQPKRIASSKAKRGTFEFIEYAASCNEPIPSYWKISRKDNDKPGVMARMFQLIKGSRKDTESFCVDVSHEVKKAIEQLVEKDLFDPQLIGHGNDAVNLSHKGIKVLDVKRVENPVLFEPYNVNRNRLFQECCRRKKICKDIKTISGSKGQVGSTEKLPDFMKTELYWEINEHYLFHGSQNIQTLVTSGPDPRVGSEGGMFGKGFYLAERTTKADQYADSKSGRSPNGKPLTLIMFRALLGNTFLCDHNHPSVQSKGSTKLSRPPCMECKKDKCSCSPQHLFDSVMGDGKWLFREFVLYDRHLCYPEYLITYKRV